MRSRNSNEGTGPNKTQTQQSESDRKSSRVREDCPCLLKTTGRWLCPLCASSPSSPQPPFPSCAPVGRALTRGPKSSPLVLSLCTFKQPPIDPEHEGGEIPVTVKAEQRRKANSPRMARHAARQKLKPRLLSRVPHERGTQHRRI